MSRSKIDVVLSRLQDWTQEYGAALCPGHHADSFGDGMREAKRQVRQILNSLTYSFKPREQRKNSES